MPSLRLKAPHTHAGVAHPAGHVLDVAPHIARWLLDHGIAEACDPASESASAPAMASSRPAKPISKE
jgi:hypothetical protein